MNCRFGRSFDAAHRSCRSCVAQSVATCKGSVPLPKRQPKDWPGALCLQIELMGLPKPAREVRFCPERRWRFDLAWEVQRVAVEVDGGVFSQGRHTRGKGYEADCEKKARAVALGWKVVSVTPDQIKRGEAVSWIKDVLAAA